MGSVLRTFALCAVLTMATDPIGGGTPPEALTATGIVDAAARASVDAGGAVFAILPAGGPDLDIFGLTHTRADAQRLALWTHAIEHLYQGRYMSAIGRFSDPPEAGDLAALVLDEEDLKDVRRCEPGDCGLKLSMFEMQQIRAAAAGAGEQWKPAVQAAFRQVVLARAQSYLAGGLARMPAYHDGREAVSPAAEFDAIIARPGLERLYGAQLLAYLEAYPHVAPGRIESFLYWSKETLGKGKPIVSITHVAIARAGNGAPATVVVSRQVFATHYLTASLSLTAITAGAAGETGYLLYLRRSRVDIFDGTFGTFVRHAVERRIRAEAPGVLDLLRHKLETGDPPSLRGE